MMDGTEGTLDILITGGTLLSMEAAVGVLEAPSIGIRDGRILFVGKEYPPGAPPPRAREVIDASGCLVLPGLVNTHTHLPMVLFRGLADDLPLMTWLNDHIFPAEGRFITPETVHAAARLAIAEMILSGTTTFCDGYFFEDAVAEAASNAAIRGVVAQGFIDFPTPDQPDPSRHAQKAESFIQRWQGRSPLITPALVCHSPYICSPETLRTIKGITRHSRALFLIHLAETREEVALLRERHGKKPAHLLADLDLLDEATIAAHCVWIDDDEIDTLARAGVKVSHNPESNMKLAAGVAPVPTMLRRGIDVGLGTDGSASNNNLDLFGEMSMCARLHKAFTTDPTVLGAETVAEMATLGGARVLGMADRIGSIAPGKCADIILVNLDKPHLTPLYHPFSHLVYAAGGADVVTSIIDGQVVMKDRHLLTVDLDEAIREVRQIGKRIAEKRK
ncbi:MAG: amidohydrolase [Thermodesulfobacteriota bacterium]